MRLLAEGRGGIGRLLKRVLQLAAGTTASQQDIETWVESLQRLLPSSYRQPAVYILLADVIITILQLKEEADLTKSAETVARLDQRVPGWRDRFSLPLEDKDAQGLVAQLLCDAVELRVEKQNIPFPLMRFLEQGEDGWQLYSSFSLPETIDRQILARFFNAEANDFPRRMDLSLQVGDQSRIVNLRHIAGHDAYRIERISCEWSGSEAAEAHMLCLAAPNGRTWFAQVVHGEEMDIEMPWIFSVDGEFRLLKQGSGKIAETEALLALPEEWRIESLNDSRVERAGDLLLNSRKIVRFQGAIQVHGDQGSFRFQTGRADATEIAYVWRGRQLWQHFISPAKAFLGKPKLHIIDQTGFQKSASGKPAFLTPNSHGAGFPFGPVVARYPASGELLFRSRMVLLPDQATIDVTAHGPRSGTITLKHWGANTARLLTSGVLLDVVKVFHTLELSFGVAPDQHTPEQVDIEVFWPRTTTPVRVRLPFPAQGVRAFDMAGRELPEGTKISMQQLLGARITIHTPRYNAHMEMVFRSSADGANRSFTLHLGTDSLQQVVRLQNYLEDIQHLLSMDDDLDTTVRVDIIVDGAEIFHLKVARYTGHLKRDADKVLLNDNTVQTLDHETLAALRIQAINLLQQDDSVIDLRQQMSEGVACGCWEVDPGNREPGPWLLYPAPDSPLMIRPLLWPIEGDMDASTPLARAMEHADYNQRQKALLETVQQLATDFQDPMWQDVEQLAGQVGHLSLTALDLWRCFAQSPIGMAALAFRLGSLPRDFLRRFAQELPFAWEIVPYSIWEQVMATLRTQCLTTFGDHLGRKVLLTHINTVSERLSDDHPALQYILGLARGFVDPEAQQNRVGLQFVVGPEAKSRLFEGNASPLQHLLRNHTQDQWPQADIDLLSMARRHPLYSEYLCPDSFGFHDLVINLPILLAVQCANGTSGEWLGDPSRIGLLRTCHAFDPDWFDEAYNLIIARCLANGLMAQTASE
ncbi:hypothetical protein GF1_17080 [Desulfolithobacter dissulfuricans]|uniref:PH domain-containing protein n=1 Tax=Desulfolithobacter dissulfuricans TaxID=2795293 RepID=A0A915U2J1_9BACT|nr:STY4851/ECs_5259 family protein [Desulfolithobacter dissulfuricans]BCO09332.1 hypothetical protein GF1_17080 [Desulfolithobacter dissulfuricans]